MSYRFQFLTLEQLPGQWDEVVAPKNRLLSIEYFTGLSNSLPYNMKLSFVAYYKDDQLIGGGILQRLFFNRHNSFNPERTMLCGLRNFVVHQLAKQVSILGNNMLSGQNGFYFDLKEITKSDSLDLLMQSANAIDSYFKPNKLTVLKDYNKAIMNLFPPRSTDGYAEFEVQPTMILELKDHWDNFNEYYESMKKKYRARIRTARKKMDDLERKELGLEDLEQNQDQMHQLYLVVAENADFNTFFLPDNHFYELKKHLKENFRVIGYYKDNILIGFYSIIHNYKELDTYFLGYESELQKTHQLYLNMLLDMVENGFQEKVDKINFGRTAIEIKSTIGAVPQNLYGLIHHQFHWTNRFLSKIFKSINVDEDFTLRSPFT